MKLVDYINEFGDLSFNEKEFNGVDKLIFANISYVNYRNILCENDKNKKRLEDAVGEFIKKKYDEERNIMAINGGIKLLKLMRNKKRYKDLLLYNYVRVVNNLEQFSALTIEISKDLVYVSFEGTDEAMIGWEEDFMMSYKFPVNAQKSAIRYLNKYFTFKKCDIILGGHSKGGNLALVSGMYANYLVRHKIKEIYSYDGPGVILKYLDSYKYKRIEGKYHHIIPCNSMIGLMLFSNKNEVIKTNFVGILSHFALNWQVDENDLISDNLKSSSIELSLKISKWLNKYSDKEKKQFVKEMFDVFRKNDVHTLLDFMDRPTSLIKILSDSSKVSHKTSIMFREFVDMTKKYLFFSVTEKII